MSVHMYYIAYADKKQGSGKSEKKVLDGTCERKYKTMKGIIRWLGTVVQEELSNSKIKEHANYLYF